MSGSIARNVVAGIAETALIQDTPSCLRSLAITQATRKLRADHVRSLITVGQQARGVVESQWLAGLHCDHGIQCPPTNDGVRYPVHPAPNPAVFPKGKIQNDSRR